MGRRSSCASIQYSICFPQQLVDVLAWSHWNQTVFPLELAITKLEDK